MSAEPGVGIVVVMGLLILGWALFTFGILYILAATPKRPPRLWLAILLLLNFSVGGLNWLICGCYSLSLGGLASLGGIDGHGSYHLKNRGTDTPVTPDVYWRLYRYERFSDTLANVGVISLLVLIAWAFGAEQLRRRARRRA